MYRNHFVIYKLQQSPNGEFLPDLNVQMEYIIIHFKEQYGVEPKSAYIGPCILAGHILVNNGEAILFLDEEINLAPFELPGYTFVTGEDTPDPT